MPPSPRVPPTPLTWRWLVTSVRRWSFSPASRRLTSPSSSARTSPGGGSPPAAIAAAPRCSSHRDTSASSASKRFSRAWKRARSRCSPRSPCGSKGRVRCSPPGTCRPPGGCLLHRDPCGRGPRTPGPQSQWHLMHLLLPRRGQIFPLLHPWDTLRVRWLQAGGAISTSMEPPSAPSSTTSPSPGRAPSAMDQTVPALPARHPPHLGHCHAFAEAYLVQRGQVPCPRLIGGGKLSSSPPREGREAERRQPVRVEVPSSWACRRMRWLKQQADNGSQRWMCRGSAISITWGYQEAPAQGCRCTRVPGATSTELRDIPSHPHPMPSPGYGSEMLCTAPDLRATEQARPTHRRQQRRGAGEAAAEAGTSSATGTAWSTEKKEVPVRLQPPSPTAALLWMGARGKAKPTRALAQDTHSMHAGL